MLLVSHDRALLDAVGTRTVAVEEPRAAQLRRAAGPSTCACAKSAVRPGPARPRRWTGATGGLQRGGSRWRERRRRCAGGRRPREQLGQDGARSFNGADIAGQIAAAGTPTSAKPKAAKPKPKPKGPSKNRLNDQQKAELAIEAAEAALREVEDALADPAAWATKYESAKSEARHTAARRAVEAAYARLEALVE